MLCGAIDPTPPRNASWRPWPRSRYPRNRDHTTVTAQPPAPGLELICSIDATLGDPLDLGETPSGHRRVIPITGGQIAGPRMRGEILPGGADWQVVQPDGWVAVEARYTARTESGQLISIVSRGVRHGSPAIMSMLLAGESPDSSEYRFRTAIAFETTEQSDYGWLNHIVAVASAIRDPAAVILDVYEVT